MAEGEISLVIVDDDPTVPRLLELALPSQAPELHIAGSASDGATAIDVVDRRRPDVAVVDHLLPDMSGIDLGRKLCQSHTGLGLVLWTGSRSDDLRVEAEAAGFGAVITKTGNLSELVEAIRLVAGGT